MDECQRQFQALLELDARHDELLDQLAELDRRVAKVLAECLAARDLTSSARPAANQAGIAAAVPELPLNGLSSAVQPS